MLKSKKQKAFTLIELLMVISIISLLSTIIYSYTTETRAKARDSVRLSDMKQIGTAMQMYYQDTGTIPTSFGDLTGGPNPYLPSTPLDPRTKQPYTFATTTNTAIVYTSYENQYIDENTPKSVGVTVGDTDLETLCAPEHTGYPNCTGGSPNDQIVFIDPGITYGGGGGGDQDQGGGIAPELPDIVFYASSSTISWGATTTILWSVSNAVSCVSSGGDTGWWLSPSRLTSGIYTTMSLVENEIYTLSCVGGAGSATSTVNITVEAQVNPISSCILADINLTCPTTYLIPGAGGCYCGGGFMTQTSPNPSLMWEYPGTSTSVIWSDASSYCSGLGGTWRLPIISELVNEIQKNSHLPLIDALYWTSELFPPNLAWAVRGIGGTSYKVPVNVQQYIILSKYNLPMKVKCVKTL